jgi:hypothetical protein
MIFRPLPMSLTAWWWFDQTDAFSAPRIFASELRQRTVRFDSNLVIAAMADVGAYPGGDVLNHRSSGHDVRELHSQAYP